MTPATHAGGSAARAPATRLICLALALAACEDFPGDPQRTVTIQQPSTAQWPAELSVKDTTRLAVDIEDENGARVSGLGVQWESDHPEVVEVRSLVPPGASGNEALLAQLSVEIVAQHRGEATVTAQVSQPGLEPSVISQKITVMEHWTSVSAGFNHTCGITIDHDAYCWGSGLLGNGSAAGSPVPVQAGRDLKFNTISAGDGHSCGLLEDGTVLCWGSNAKGAVGNGGTGDQAVPVAVSVVSILDEVVAGDNFACGVSADEQAFCWGNNENWQLGDAFLLPFQPPTGVPSPRFDDCGTISRVRCSRIPREVRDRGSGGAPNGVPLRLASTAPGVSHTCALTDDGAAVCWGSGSAELGAEVDLKTDSASAITFVAVPGGTALSRISSGNRHSCALHQGDGRIYCWGFNSHGQLGREVPGSSCEFGIPENVGCSPAARPIDGGVRFSDLDAGGNTSCGLAADSTAYCWGSNDLGQLGDPSVRRGCDVGAACSASPLPVDLAGQPLVSLSVGPGHACAVTSRGAAFCWGDSAGGKLGARDATGTGVHGPVRVDEPAASGGAQ